VRILVWSPNYAPELIGIPPLVTEAAEWLAGRGHVVHVVTALPNYPERRIRPGYAGALWRRERLGDVDVTRSWLRVRPNESFLDKVLYELTFMTFSAPHVLRRLRSADVVLCVVPSLLAAGAASAAIAALQARARLVLWVQDLVVRASAAVDAASLARSSMRIAERIERAAWRAADGVVVCSPGFVEHVTAAGAPLERVSVVLNWAPVDTVEPAPLPPSSGPTRFLYSGNLGYTQGFDTLLEAASLAGPAVELKIAGAGNAAEDVRHAARGLPNVSVQPPVAREAFGALLASAHAHVVIQRAAAAGANLPSKIGSYLASGRAIVASAPGGTPAAELLRRSGAAVLVDAESPSALAEAMLDLHSHPELLTELGDAGREFAVAELSPTRQLARLERALTGRHG
jgi:putative colanic acid biosynthesis glycosyltransferase WcaI